MLIIPAVGLCPKIPLNNPGTRILPAISEPRPNSDAPEPISAPSPPDELRDFYIT